VPDFGRWGTLPKGHCAGKEHVPAAWQGKKKLPDRLGVSKDYSEYLPKNNSGKKERTRTRIIASRINGEAK